MLPGLWRALARAQRTASAAVRSRLSASSRSGAANPHAPSAMTRTPQPSSSPIETLDRETAHLHPTGVRFGPGIYTLDGGIDPALMARAWQCVVDRHAILRTAFDWSDVERPVQVVHRDVRAPFTCHDLRGLPARD